MYHSSNFDENIVCTRHEVSAGSDTIRLTKSASFTATVAAIVLESSFVAFTATEQSTSSGAGGAVNFKRRRRYILPDGQHVMAYPNEIQRILAEYADVIPDIPKRKKERRTYIVEGEVLPQFDPIDPIKSERMTLDKRVEYGLPTALTVEQLERRLKRRREEEWLISLLH